MNGGHVVCSKRHRGRSLSGSRAMASEALDWIRPPPPDDESAATSCFPSESSAAEKIREPSSQELHARFLQAVKKLSGSGHVSLPKIGSKPIHPRPFDYNRLMRAFGQVGEVDEVLRLFGEMKESKCKPNVLCYNTVINALVMAERPEEAEAVFEEMILSGVSPNVSSYNILVKMHSWYARRFDLAYEVLLRMKGCGHSPDTTTYSTLIAGLCRVGRIREALGVLDWMLEEKCSPTVHTYTPIVQGYCHEGRIEEAKSLMAAMRSVGCPPNCVTYNILIDALCKVGSFNEVEKVLGESELKGWKPNAITYNTYIDGLCKSHKAKEAFQKLEVMLGNGLSPTAVTLNILLDCLCHDSKVWEAKCLLERSSELEWDVGVVGYNTVMSRLCEIGRWSVVLKLLIDMFKKGISPNTRTFNIVIHSLCIGGKFRKAKCLISSRGFVPDVVTYNTMIHWFYLEGTINEVQHLFYNMDVQKITPDAITYTILINGLCKQGKYLEAADCFLGSLEYGYSKDLVVSLTCRLIRCRRLKEMLDLWKGLERQGFFPDVLIFETTIRAFCREGFCRSTDIYKVCLVLDQMLRRS
ncbi:pentatricopeptide repeat-containing protein At1g63400-like [Phoenix dactylifera]|uniref:Pentatricopeptide repeat-containing protein At1g63400-like n=1 Tax=Phoenix dactylifera TaxID=42345 RepID=A0A8B8J9N3_PHODC|nr:pentatricopeptide repeat-containing protein At1g63400-like [Phoenix dactylifera]XP_026664124.2 pentatricopeptide repeat-containing protein At1g63400-like [Phoenix dactylifera]XP_026664125.2 pentatricopeptide repeat-containing protein At1g63400-like [Phoenix dactylifera]